MRSLLFRWLGPVQRMTSDEVRVTVLMWAAGVAQGYAGAHATNTLPYARLSLRLSEADMAGVLSVSRIGALMAVLFSMWSDRKGRKWPFLAALTLLFVGSTLTGFTQSEATFTSAQVLVRWGATSAALLGVVVLVEAVSPRVRGFVVSVYAAATSLGAGLGTAALAFADRSPDAWRVIFFSSALALIMVPALAIKLKATDADPDVLRSWWSHVDHRAFMLLASSSLVLAAFTAVSVSFTFERFIDDLGLSGAQAALLSLVGGTIGGLGFFVGGRLTDAWGRRPTAIVGSGLAVAGGTALFYAETTLALGLFIFIGAFGSFMLAPSMGTLRNELFPAPVRTRAVTWANSIAVIGSVLGLSFAKASIDRLGLDGTVLRLALAAAIGVGLLALLPETTPQPTLDARSQ